MNRPAALPLPEPGTSRSEAKLLWEGLAKPCAARHATGLQLRPAHLTARPADLATVSDRYVQVARSVSAWYSYIGTRYQAQTSFIGGPSPPVRLPAILVE